MAYNRLKVGLLDGTVNCETDTLKAMLVGTGYTPNVDDDFADTPAAAEISVTGYTPGFGGTGRKTLASKVFTLNDTNDRGDFGAANLSWTALGAGATVAGVVIYKHTGSDAASPLICYLDVVDTLTNGGDLNVNFSGGLLLQVT